MKIALIVAGCALALSTTFAAAQMNQPQGGMSGMSKPQGSAMENGLGMEKKPMMMKRKKMSRKMMMRKRMRSM